jgi:hypothetical protein
MRRRSLQRRRLFIRPAAAGFGVCVYAGPMRNGSGAFAGVAELADALDSKSSDRKIVWVRAPPPAAGRWPAW